METNLIFKIFATLGIASAIGLTAACNPTASPTRAITDEQITASFAQSVHEQTGPTVDVSCHSQQIDAVGVGTYRCTLTASDPQVGTATTFAILKVTGTGASWSWTPIDGGTGNGQQGED